MSWIKMKILDDAIVAAEQDYGRRPSVIRMSHRYANGLRTEFYKADLCTVQSAYKFPTMYDGIPIVNAGSQAIGFRFGWS